MFLCECQCSRAVLPSWLIAGIGEKNNQINSIGSEWRLKCPAPSCRFGTVPYRKGQDISSLCVCAPEGGQNVRQPTHSRFSTRRSGLSKMSPFILSGYSAVAKHEVIHRATPKALWCHSWVKAKVLSISNKSSLVFGTCLRNKYSVVFLCGCVQEPVEIDMWLYSNDEVGN